MRTNAFVGTPRWDLAAVPRHVDGCLGEGRVGKKGEKKEIKKEEEKRGKEEKGGKK